MGFNFLKIIKQRRKAKRELKKQTSLLKMLATFDQAEASVLIFFDDVNKRVLLSDILTGPFILNNTATKNFFHNLQLWLQWKIQTKYWEKKYIGAEVEAVKEYKSKNKHTSAKDIQVIREQARLSIPYDNSDMEVIDEYEICICSGVLKSSAQAEAIGYWKNNQLILSSLNV